MYIRTVAVAEDFPIKTRDDLWHQVFGGPLVEHSVLQAHFPGITQSEVLFCKIEEVDLDADTCPDSQRSCSQSSLPIVPNRSCRRIGKGSRETSEPVPLRGVQHTSPACVCRLQLCKDR